jgi:hypothetical protein
MIRITKIEIAGPYRLNLVFSDGECGDVDLSDAVGRGVFTVLAQESEFGRASIANDGRSVSWPNGVDLCTDALYQEAVGRLPAPISSKAFLLSSQAEAVLKDIDVHRSARKNAPVRTSGVEAA